MHLTGPHGRVRVLVFPVLWAHAPRARPGRPLVVTGTISFHDNEAVIWAHELSSPGH